MTLTFTTTPLFLVFLLYFLEDTILKVISLSTSPPSCYSLASCCPSRKILFFTVQSLVFLGTVLCRRTRFELSVSHILSVLEPLSDLEQGWKNFKPVRCQCCGFRIQRMQTDVSSFQFATLRRTYMHLSHILLYIRAFAYFQEVAIAE
jgi:hypothetical protein